MELVRFARVLQTIANMVRFDEKQKFKEKPKSFI